MGRSGPAGATDHAPPPGPAAAVPVRWPLVGRDEHLSEVIEALLGPQAAVVVAGSAGIGRTRLVQEALEVMATKGYATEWAMASAEARTITFGALTPWLSKTNTPNGMQPLTWPGPCGTICPCRPGHRQSAVPVRDQPPGPGLRPGRQRSGPG